MKAKKSKLFDVVIFSLETRVIDSVVGFGMARNTGFYNAEKRLDTVRPRLNDKYVARIVPSGKFRKGDVLPTRYK